MNKDIISGKWSQLKGKAQAKRANSKLKNVAEKQPLALVAGAVAVGALLGSLLPKGARKDEE